MAFRKLLAALIGGVVSVSGLAGEVVGNVFIGKQNGAIEVAPPAGKWELRDTESEGPTSVVSLKLKDAISGSYPGCAVTSMPGMVASIEAHALADMLHKSMSEAGMKLGPTESRRYGGKNVLVFSTSISKGDASAKGETFLLRGEKDYFIVNCSANSAAYDAAQPLFRELVDTGLKY